MKVYLAGGMHTEWRSKVKGKFPSDAVKWLDPCGLMLAEAQAYTLWDLASVGVSDVVFAYLEKDNPSGLGMFYEMGFAKALGKKVIFVNERYEDEDTHIAGCAADWHGFSLQDGISVLGSLWGVL